MVIEVTTEERIINVTVASYADLYASVIAAEVAAGESLASATEAAASAVAAAASAVAAALSETNAAAYESAAADSEAAAGVSAAEAAASAATFTPALFLAKADNLSGLASTSTAQTNLGISTFAKTLLDDADDEEARETLGAQAHSDNLTDALAAYALPTVDGDNDGDVLKTNAAGVTRWEAPSEGMKDLYPGGVTFSNVAYNDVTDLHLSGYQNFKIVIENLLCATDNVLLELRMLTTAGAVVNGGSGGHEWARMRINSSGTYSDAGDNNADYIELAAGVGDDTNTREGLGGEFMLYGLPTTSEHTKCTFGVSYYDNSEALRFSVGAGARRSHGAEGGFRLEAQSGNISGTIHVFGVGAAP